MAGNERIKSKVVHNTGRGCIKQKLSGANAKTQGLKALKDDDDDDEDDDNDDGNDDDEDENDVNV